MIKKLSSIAGVAAFVISVFMITPQAFAAASVQSVKMGGANTITVTYSQPVYTSASDYTNLTGSFNGFSVTSALGSGTNTIVLILNSSAPTSGTGSITIGSNVQDVSDGQYFAGGTWTIVPLVVVPPALTSFSMSSSASDGTFAGTSDALTISFSFNESVTIQLITVAGHQVSAMGNGSGPYMINYTMQSGDAQQSVPVTIALSDTYGNQSHINLSYSGTTAGTSGTSMIASITSNANTSGILSVGDSITFTLTPTIVQPNARISGYYNGVPLTWTTSNGGINYTATYTVAYGQPSQSYPVQISGVTLTDQYGNVSAPVAGYDVQKNINTLTQSQGQGPIITQVTAVPSLVTTPTPTYTFYSTGSGSMTFGGACTSQTVSAIAGLNTITFNSLANGTYSNCTIGVVGNTGTLGNTLMIPTFTVSGSSVGTTPVTTQTVDSLTTQLQALQSQLMQLQGQNGNVASSYQFTNPLKVGSKGTDVTELQKRLTAEGVYSGPINGSFGPLTEAAVKKYQTSYGLTPLGSVGPGTRAALNNGK